MNTATYYNDMGDRICLSFGWAFEPHPRSESAPFGGGTRNCATALYEAASSPDEAMEIARQRGETSETGTVLRVCRSTFGGWRVATPDDIAKLEGNV